MDTRTILLVEDDEALRSLYQLTLEMNGLTVLTARNGEEGIESALANHPDLIVADLLMPKMDGITMMNKIREDVWGRKAKVIFLTNLTDPESVFHSFKLKPEEYIVKIHTDVKEVVNKIRAAMTS
jgi:two-component system, OmpR family, response regulator TrcR